MGLTNYAIEQMGFEAIPEDVQIDAYFRSINVYEVRGITSDKESPFKPEELKNVTDDFSFSLGDNVNAICNLLAGEDFADDEEKWRSETKSTPPYLVVLTKLGEPAICTQGYWKHIDDKIITHDCFSETKESLKKLENKKTSALVAALSASLSSANHPVIFIPLSREVFAETNYEKRLRDCRFSFSVEGYVSSRITTEAISEKIALALSRYGELHPKVGYFFDLAIREKDNLKRFIYYFLVIEIHTHRAFSEIDYGTKFEELHNLPSRIAESAAEFLIDRQKESKNLFQRFIWCSILKWSEVDDSDISAFKSIKKIRDRIYHGEEVVESSLPIHQVQSLALKLLRS